MGDKELFDKVEKGLECCGTKEHCHFGEGGCPWFFPENPDDCTSRLSCATLSLLKAQEPKAPTHIHEEYPEHDWERRADGSIDEFAAESDYHNGPRCKRCNETFCVHCEPDGYETHKPCIVDEDHCPKCGKELFPPWGKEGKVTYCVDCGQAVKWDE